MPSLILDNHQMQVSPSVLMAVDFDSSNQPAQSGITCVPSAPRAPSDDLGSLHVSAVRLKSPSRPRSYIHVLEDLNHDGRSALDVSENLAPSERTERSSCILDELAESEEETSLAESVPLSAPPEVEITPIPRPRRNEDTIRRRKRFSLPALAIHTTPVTARPNAVGDGKSKRWSLVLGNWRPGGPSQDSPDSPKHGVVVGKLNEMLKRHSQIPS